MNSRRISASLVGIGCLLAACVHRSVLPAPVAGAAVVDRDSAFFVFPAESAARLTWNLPGQGKGPGSADRTWEVSWDPAAIGTDSASQIAVDRRYRPGEPPREGTLAQLLAETLGEEGSPCWHCEPPAIRVTRRADINAHAANHRVIVVVHGRALVQHLFWSHPSRVILRWSGALSDFTDVRVDYR